MKVKTFLIMFGVLSVTVFSFANEMTTQTTINGEVRKVTSQDLIGHARQWDGQGVIFQGEVIGDVMPRRNFVWFNVQDDFGAIGIWAPEELAVVVTRAGDYRYRGDVVEIEGQFLRADPLLKGELCIRAQKINILQKGAKTNHPLHPFKIEITLLLLALTVCAGVLRLNIKRKISS